MVASEGHDACLMQTLQQAAACLAPLSALHCPIRQALLPEAVKLGCQEAAEHTQHAQAMRLNANGLAASNQGIVYFRCDVAANLYACLLVARASALVSTNESHL